MHVLVQIFRKDHFVIPKRTWQRTKTRTAKSEHAQKEMHTYTDAIAEWSHGIIIKISHRSVWKTHSITWNVSFEDSEHHTKFSVSEWLWLFFSNRMAARGQVQCSPVHVKTIKTADGFLVSAQNSFTNSLNPLPRKERCTWKTVVEYKALLTKKHGYTRRQLSQHIVPNHFGVSLKFGPAMCLEENQTL